MSYSVDELYTFMETESGYSVVEYLKRDNPTITEIEVPAEYNGKPVTIIEESAFKDCKYLRKVCLPDSIKWIKSWAFGRCSELCEVRLSEGLEMIGEAAFQQTKLKTVRLPKSLKEMFSVAFCLCEELESVEIGGSPWFDMDVFFGCPKLAPETIVMGLVRSTDITQPILTNVLDLRRECFRRDVFEILVQNNCFSKCSPTSVFKGIINNKKAELFPIAEEHGITPSREIIDELISCSVKWQSTECTAYLLDLKNRKFGFNNGGDKFEL